MQRTGSSREECGRLDPQHLGLIDGNECHDDDGWIRHCTTIEVGLKTVEVHGYGWLRSFVLYRENASDWNL